MRAMSYEVSRWKFLFAIHLSHCFGLWHVVSHPAGVGKKQLPINTFAEAAKEEINLNTAQKQFSAKRRRRGRNWLQIRSWNLLSIDSSVVHDQLQVNIRNWWVEREEIVTALWEIKSEALQDFDGGNWSRAWKQEVAVISATVIDTVVYNL